MLNRDCTVRSISLAAQTHLHDVYAAAPAQLIDDVSRFVAGLFAGEHPDFQAADLRYHNLAHTLLATQCFIDVAAGRARHQAQSAFDARTFSLGYAAIMLHDTGYVKEREDFTGTGAKHTSSHVARSGQLARKLLPDLGCTSDEIEGIVNAIACTGLSSRIADIPFASAQQRVTGCMVATADYLGQMSDPDYPEKLPALFAEMEEANDFNGVPAEQRPFRSAHELRLKTAGFWTAFVLPLLENDYEGVYRQLALPNGTNPYLEAVERNLAVIATQAAA
jgi:hypothetical protein